VPGYIQFGRLPSWTRDHNPTLFQTKRPTGGTADRALSLLVAVAEESLDHAT